MLLVLSAIVMALTALLHSIVGERRLIGPLLDLNAGVMRVPLARQVLRFAWHLTSVLMIACAFAVAWPGTPREVIVAVGVAWLGCGLFDAVYTRGKHLGWPFLAAAGVLALLDSAI